MLVRAVETATGGTKDSQYPRLMLLHVQNNQNYEQLQSSTEEHSSKTSFGACGSLVEF